MNDLKEVVKKKGNLIGGKQLVLYMANLNCSSSFRYNVGRVLKPCLVYASRDHELLIVQDHLADISTCLPYRWLMPLHISRQLDSTNIILHAKRMSVLD